MLSVICSILARRDDILRSLRTSGSTGNFSPLTFSTFAIEPRDEDGSVELTYRCRLVSSPFWSLIFGNKEDDITKNFIRFIS